MRMRYTPERRKILTFQLRVKLDVEDEDIEDEDIEDEDIDERILRWRRRSRANWLLKFCKPKDFRARIADLLRRIANLFDGNIP